ncbi:hypothetical protein ACHAPT_009494 [Fusarium lateritium]
MTFQLILVYTALTLFGKAIASPAYSPPSNSSIPSIKWSKCGNQVPLGVPVPDSIDCGHITVPLDHYNPSDGSVQLGMMRLKAKGPREGILFFNSGGPGMPSSITVHRQGIWEAEDKPGRLPDLSADLRNSFDIIGLDLRGEGLSSPMSCDKDLFNKVVLNVALDDASYERLVKHNQAVAESCSRMTGPLFSKMGTDQRIRDIDLVRQSAGAPVLNWIGWSGGSQIGAEYAELYPDKVGRMALDGINARQMGVAESIYSEAVAFDAALEYFFKWCNSTSECALHERDVASIFDTLVDAAEKEPLPAPGCVETKLCHPNVTSEDMILRTLMWMAAGHPTPRPRSTIGYYALAEALAEAHDNGNATRLSREMVLSDTATVQIYFPHVNVLCSDYTRDFPGSAAEMRSLFTPARALAPHSRGINVNQHARTLCLGWPFEPTDPPHFFDPKRMERLPPIMIVNGLYDAATVVGWAAVMREQMPTGINVWRNAGGHTSYNFMGETQKAMDAFLLNGTIPWDGTVYKD